MSPESRGVSSHSAPSHPRERASGFETHARDARMPKAERGRFERSFTIETIAPPPFFQSRATVRA